MQKERETARKKERKRDGETEKERRKEERHMASEGEREEKKKMEKGGRGERETLKCDGRKVNINGSYDDNMNEDKVKKAKEGKKKGKKENKAEEDEDENANRCGFSCFSKPRKPIEVKDDEVNDGEETDCCCSCLHPCTILYWILEPAFQLRKRYSCRCEGLCLCAWKDMKGDLEETDERPNEEIKELKEEETKEGEVEMDEGKVENQEEINLNVFDLGDINVKWGQKAEKAFEEDKRKREENLEEAEKEDTCEVRFFWEPTNQNKKKDKETEVNQTGCSCYTFWHYLHPLQIVIWLIGLLCKLIRRHGCECFCFSYCRDAEEEDRLVEVSTLTTGLGDETGENSQQLKASDPSKVKTCQRE